MSAVEAAVRRAVGKITLLFFNGPVDFSLERHLREFLQNRFMKAFAVIVDAFHVFPKNEGEA